MFIRPALPFSALEAAVDLALERLAAAATPLPERALGAHVDALPVLDQLAAIADLQRHLGLLVADDVAEARRRGASWSDVGNALQITKQTAHERFGP